MRTAPALLAHFAPQFATRFLALLFAGLMLAGLLLAPPVLAAGNDDDSGSYSSSKAKPAGYYQAVRQIKAEEFAAALPLLLELVKKAPKDADIHNLLGFSYRKTGDLARAASHYETALTLDPKHKGALEYQGELFLMQGNRAAAEANLAKLKKICWLGCDALEDLKAALAKQ